MYRHSYDIDEAFCHLNTRFENMVIYPSKPLSIQFSQKIDIR